MEKFHGQNWFADLPWASWQVGFPWPFSLISVDANWFMATWSELIFSIMLLLGLFTRFTAFSLFVVTVVATVAVHWPNSWDSLGQLWQRSEEHPSQLQSLMRISYAVFCLKKKTIPQKP